MALKLRILGTNKIHFIVPYSKSEVISLLNNHVENMASQKTFTDFFLSTLGAYSVCGTIYDDSFELLNRTGYMTSYVFVGKIVGSDKNRCDIVISITKPYIPILRWLYFWRKNWDKKVVTEFFTKYLKAEQLG